MRLGESAALQQRRLWRQRRSIFFIAACLASAGGIGLAARLEFADGSPSLVRLPSVRAEPVNATLPEAPIATGGIAFAEVARERGLLHEWPRQPRPMRLRETFGCGCAAFDYDNDGRQDVLLVADPHPVLFRNAGDRFENVTASLGLAFAEKDRTRRAAGRRSSRSRFADRRGQAPIWTGAAVGDYDGDGWLDLLLTGFHRLALLKNDSGKTFIDVTTSAGLDRTNRGRWASSAGFMDLDGDARLDLVILNYVEFGPASKQYCELTPGVVSACPPQFYAPEQGQIWRNAGHGAFELVPDSFGMNDTRGAAMVLAFTDLDGDNRQDFLIGNDGQRADFMHNLGGMRFENIALAIGLAIDRDWAPMAAMGADWADFDRDGWLDLTVTDFQKNGFTLFRHDAYEKGDGARWHGFEEIGKPTGVSRASYDRLGFGAKWLDMDNDAWPDLCYANGHVYDNAGEIKASETLRQSALLLRNDRGRRFVDLTPALDPALAKPIVGRGSASADFDNDGRMDVLVVDYEGSPLLFENRSQTANHWVKFDLRGAAPNTFAYGARIAARAQGQIWVGEVSPASSYLSSSDPRIHFGLGELSLLETVTIRWPSGRVEELHDVSADQIVRVVEGQGIDLAP